MPSDKPLPELLEKLVAAVEEAAAFSSVMQDVGYGDADGRQKSANFATGADRAVEIILRAALSRIVPEAGYVSEDEPRESSNGHFWVVDPIDGTGNFASGMEYAVSVAYMDAGGEVVAGAVCCPRSGSTHYAGSGSGAFVKAIGSDGAVEKLVLPKQRKTKGSLFFGMPRHPEKAPRAMGNVGSVAFLFDDVKRIGPTSLDICKTASGMACCYLGMEPEPWDIAAASLVVAEAGGAVERFGDLIAIGDPGTVSEMMRVLGWDVDD